MQHVISYDIACQWATNFSARVKNLPEHVRFEVPTGGQLRYAIPKFHFRAHKPEGHDQFSFYVMLGVGRVDGEEIERNWSRNNNVAYSTREMGPGSRHDTLEDHFAFANWQKYTGLGEFCFPSKRYQQLTSAFPIGTYLRKRLKNASVEKIVLDRIFDDFCEQLQPANVTAWTEQVTTWEKDTSLPSPYQVPTNGKNFVALHIQSLTRV